MRFFNSAAVFCCCALPSLALAGAWTQNAEDGQLIVTGSVYRASHFYDNAGHRRAQPTYSKSEINPYVEYGWRDGLTVGANLLLDRAQQRAGASQQTNWGLGDSEFFLRQRLWQRHGWAFSAEPMIKLPSPESSRALPRLGGSHPDAGLGLSGGYAFRAWGLDHFADLDAQCRHRFGAPKDQMRLAATLGLRLSPRWMMMPQAFLTYRISPSASPGFTQSSADDYNQTRLQLSLLYKATDGVSVQFGGFRDAGGKNTGAGSGMLAAVWTSF